MTVKQWVINPKAQPLHQLYGFMDPETRDWTDGVLSRIFRDLNQPLPTGRENEMRWLIYDGDVDALWVEVRRHFCLLCLWWLVLLPDQ